MLTINNETGEPIAIESIRSGLLHALASFDDYDIKAGRDYKVHYTDDIGAFILPKDTIRLWNNELRPDVAAKLIWINN